MRYARLVLVCMAVFAMLAACRRVVVPQGEPAERARAESEGAPFALPVEQRRLPDLSNSATLTRVLEYAYNTNGDLEAAYRDWRAAIERVVPAGSLPDPQVQFRAMFGPDAMTDAFGAQWQQLRLGVSQELPGRGKRKARAELALGEAQAAGQRFAAARFSLRRKVIQSFADAVLNAQLLQETSETLRLLRSAYDVATHRYHAMTEKGLGESLPDLLKLEVEIQTVESEQRSLQIAGPKLRAELNALLNRPPDAPLAPLQWPAIQRPEASDADLFARAVQNNPDLEALRKEVEAKGVAQVLAELEKRPDFTVGAMMNAQRGDVWQYMPMLEGGMTLPVNRARIRAGIAEALAARQAVEARLRAASADTQARVLIALAGVRDAERILSDYRARILPKTEELLATQITAYGSGGGDLLDILDTQRLLVDFRKLVLRAEADRLRYLAELEEVIGEDLLDFGK